MPDNYCPCGAFADEPHANTRACYVTRPVVAETAEGLLENILEYCEAEGGVMGIDVATAECVALIEARDAAIAQAAELRGRRAVLEELEAEALHQYREARGPGELTNEQRLQCAVGAFSEAIDILKAKYAADTSGTKP